MKIRLLWALLSWLSLLSFGARAQTNVTIARETFEGLSTDQGYSSNTMGAGNVNIYFERRMFTTPGGATTTYSGAGGSSSPSYVSNQQGSYAWMAERVRGNANTGVNANIRVPGYVQLNPITTTNYKNLRVVVAMADPRCASGCSGNTVYYTDRVRVRYSFDGGPFVTAGLLVNSGGTSSLGFWGIDTSAPLDSVSDSDLGTAYRDVTGTISGTGSSLRIQVVVDANLPEITFDNIRVIGDADAGAKPALANIEAATNVLSYTEGQPSPVQVTSSLTVGYSDNSATNITGGTVTISSGFTSGDQLNYSTQGGISGTYSNGVLTLTGTTTQANYQAALRSVTFSNSNTSTLPNGTRQITFQLSNGTAQSNTPLRNLNVNAVLTTGTLPYTENFNSDGEGTRYFGNSFVRPAVTTGFFRATTSPAYSGSDKIGDLTYTGWSGGYWYGEGTKVGTTGTAIQLAPVNAAGAVGLKFVVAVGSSSNQGAGSNYNWDAASDYFRLYYRVGGSSGTWTEFGSFIPDATGVLRRGGNTDSVAVGTALRYFTFPLPAAAAVNGVDFQLLQASDGDEELAFDNIRISAQTTVTSIVRASANPTNLATVNYTVTFGAAVTGLTASNFTLTANGFSTAPTIGTPVQGTGNTWTVPVNTGAGSGNLTLNLANDTNLSYDISNTLPFAGETYNIDKAAPTGTAVTTPANGSLVNTATPTYSGTAEANSTVAVYVDGSSIGTTTANGSGAWSRVQPTGLSQGSHTVYATATDAAGNTGTSATNNFIVDTVAPAAPVITAPAANAVVTTTTPTISGTAEANSTVIVKEGSTTLGTTTATGAGAWSLTSSTLAQGSHTISVTATDAAGNVSPASTRTFTVDSQAPTVTLTNSNSVAAGGTTTLASLSFTATFNEPVTGFDISDISVSNGTRSSFATVSTTVYTFTVTPTANGTVTVTIPAGGAVDGAGNGNTAGSFSFFYQSPNAIAKSVTVNLGANGTGTLQASDVNNGSTGAGTPTYTIQKIVYGRVAENSTLTLTTPNGANFTGIRFASYGTPTNDPNGNYRKGSCDAANSVTTAQNSFSTTRSTGSMDATNGSTANNSPTLGDPCSGTPKALAVQAAYSADATSLSYNCDEAGKTQYVLLTVTDANGNSNTTTALVTVNAPPAISVSNLSPNSAQRGAMVTVTGSNLGGIGSTVTVNGATATVSNLTNTGGSAYTFTFVVPNTATIGAGNLTVTAPCSQTVTSTFTVTAPALTATVSTTSGSPTSTSPIPFSVSFSQSVGSTFTASDLASTVINGTVNSSSFSGSGSGPYTFTVTPSGTGAVTVSLAANVAQDANNTGNSASNSVSVQYQSPAITITPTSLPSGTVGQAYSQTLTASGGTGPYTYSIVGTLPGGLSLTGNTISGTPTADGSFTFTVRATDSGTPVATGDQSYTLTIARPTISLSPSSLPGSTVGVAYSQTLTAAGGTAPYRYIITIGGLPAGLTLSSGGVLSGTPTAGGSYTFTVTATDAYNSTGSQAYTLTVAAPTITVAPLMLPNGTQGVAYNQTITASGGTAPYRFTTTPSTLPPGLTLSSGGVLSGTPTAGGSYTFTVTATDASTGGSYTGSRIYTLSITTTFTSWTGNDSNDWFTASNWTGGVPTATVDATIPTSPSGNRFPFIRSGTAIARNLTINSNAAVAQDGGTLDVRANLTNNGSFTPTGGTAILGAGTVVSSILGSSSTRFFNLTVGASAAQSNTSASTSVQQLLTLNGNFTTNANSFILESNATSTAMVVNNGSNVVSGNVTVQRYIDASGNTGTSGYRHYSSPVGGAMVNSLSTIAYGGSFMAQVNAAYNTADPNQLTLATYPNVFSYDESKIAGSPAASFSDFDKGYQSPRTLNDALTVGRGYAVQIGNTEKVQFNGPLNNSTQTINGLTYATGTPGAASAGWALVGNPYPAPLDWRTVGTATGSSLTGVDGAAYVFQSTSAYAGRYTSFTNNVGAGTGLIASGQGFFVRASTPGTTGSITLTNANRVTSYANPAFQRPTAETRPLLRLSLTLGSQPATAATAQDETFVYFETGATDGVDGRFDAYKLANPSGYYLGSVTPGSTPLGLSIDGRAPLAAATTTEIPLWVSLPAGTYTLTATELLNFATLAGGTTVQLRDALLGTLTDLATVPSHRFSVAANAAYAGRFSLVFRTSGVLATLPGTELTQAKASLYPNPAISATALSVTDLPTAITSLQVEVVDVLGRVVGHYTLPVRAGSAHQSLATDQLASTLYLLRLTALDAKGQVQGTLPTQRLTLNR